MNPGKVSGTVRIFAISAPEIATDHFAVDVLTVIFHDVAFHPGEPGIRMRADPRSLKPERRVPTAEIQAWLDEHFAEPLRMEQLAAKYGMSLPTFNNRFREAFNMTPYQYLIQTRLLYAARLLGESSLTIKEICSQSGYGSPFHFSAEFSRFYGCSPREFRRKNREF